MMAMRMGAATLLALTPNNYPGILGQKTLKVSGDTPTTHLEVGQGSSFKPEQSHSRQGCHDKQFKHPAHVPATSLPYTSRFAATNPSHD